MPEHPEHIGEASRNPRINRLIIIIIIIIILIPIETVNLGTYNIHPHTISPTIPIWTSLIEFVFTPLPSAETCYGLLQSAKELRTRETNHCWMLGKWHLFFDLHYLQHYLQSVGIRVMQVIMAWLNPKATWMVKA